MLGFNTESFKQVKAYIVLKIIEPKSHNMYRATIDSFLDLLKQHHDLIFSPEIRDRSIFLIASAENFSPSGSKSEGEIYGGAILYPQKIPSVLDLADTDTNEEMVIKLTSFFQPKGEEYWTARICLCLEMDTSAAAILETQDISHRFYKELYQAFNKFGKAEGIDYLAYSLRVFETYNVKTFERWPYQLGIMVADPDHEFAQGILSLTGKAFKARGPQKLGRQP